MIANLNPDPTQWTQHLRQEGKQGGWKATLMTEGETHEPLTEKPRQQERL